MEEYLVPSGYGEDEFVEKKSRFSDREITRFYICLIIQCQRGIVKKNGPKNQHKK